MWQPRRLIGAVLALLAAVALLLSPFFALFIGRLDLAAAHITMTIDGWGFTSDAPQMFGAVPVNAYPLVLAGVLLFAGAVAALIGARRPGVWRGVAVILAIATAFTVGVAATVTPQVTSWIESFSPVGISEATVDTTLGLGFWLMLVGTALSVAATVMAVLPVRDPVTPPYGFPVPVRTEDRVDPHGAGGSA